jgi:hypothetical protein
MYDDGDLNYNPSDADPCFPAIDVRASLQSFKIIDREGGKMYVLTFSATDGRVTREVSECIIMPKFLWKIKRYAYAIGAGEAFEAGTFKLRDQFGKPVTLSLIVDEGKGTPRNFIAEYKPAVPAEQPMVDPGGDLPF